MPAAYDATSAAPAAPVAPAEVAGTISVRENASASDADAYAAGHPHASAYHQSEWLDVVRHAFAHRTTRLVAEASGRVVGVLPLVLFSNPIFGRFAVSMPFFNYGGVLADTPAAERALLDRAIELTRAAGGTYLELRHTRQLFPDLTPKRHKVAMTAALHGTVDAQWDAIDRKVRNQVRKAEKSGLNAVVGGIELLPQFYEVFARNMRDLGTPVYGAGFFREVLTRTADRSRLVVVTAGARTAAAALVHWHGDTIEVPWASARREFNPLCANVFLYWQMVRFAVERGCRVFDFGRSTPGEGTFHFKKQWGAEAHQLVWEYWTAPGQPVPQLSPKNPKFDLAIRVWQRLPVPIATALGPRIVRNIP
jgi:FemAB-related protein (PEP-CTERM system-associated)